MTTKHLIRKIKLFFKGDKRAKYPESVMDIENVIYPYFLKAFDKKPEEYEEARDLLDQCVEDVYLKLKGKTAKYER